MRPWVSAFRSPAKYLIALIKRDDCNVIPFKVQFFECRFQWDAWVMVDPD
jgi:hypothetical protein